MFFELSVYLLYLLLLECSFLPFLKNDKFFSFHIMANIFLSFNFHFLILFWCLINNYE